MLDPATWEEFLDGPRRTHPSTRPIPKTPFCSGTVILETCEAPVQARHVVHGARHVLAAAPPAAPARRARPPNRLTPHTCTFGNTPGKKEPRRAVGRALRIITVGCAANLSQISRSSHTPPPTYLRVQVGSSSSCCGPASVCRRSAEQRDVSKCPNASSVSRAGFPVRSVRPPVHPILQSFVFEVALAVILTPIRPGKEGRKYGEVTTVFPSSVCAM